MTLFERMMCDCVRLIPSTVDDDEGGRSTTWSEGDHIKAAIVRDTSQELRVADKDIAKAIYTVTTPSGTVLNYHDVIKRMSDGAVFRATSNSNPAPHPATFSFRQCSAEEWRPIE